MVMRRILLADDDILARYALAEWLRERGHEVVEASSGDEALTVLSSRVEIDLVITDVRMPGTLDGLDLTRSIRTGSRPLPVIVISGDVREQDVQAADATAFFHKPLDFEQLAACVEVLIPPHRPDNRRSAATG
jgi:two-component system, response regulator PdtaR